MPSNDDIYNIYIQNAIESYIGMTTVSLWLTSNTCSTKDKKILIFHFLCFFNYGQIKEYQQYINDGHEMDHFEASMRKVYDDGYLLQQRWLQ